MTHAPTSPISSFAAALEARSELKDAGIRVALGREELARTTATRRIVLVPTQGQYAPPDRERERHEDAPVLAVVQQGMAARIWGHSIDDAWDIQQRLFQALTAYTAAGGYRFAHEDHTWNTEADTSEQGEELIVRFRLLLPIQRSADLTTTISSVQSATAIVNPSTGSSEAGPTVEAP